jgi:hypothetical protein
MPVVPVAMRAAPGVDHATMIGCWYRTARIKDVTAMAMQMEAAADACCDGDAPTARTPSITTKMVEAKPTTTAATAAEVNENR